MTNLDPKLRIYLRAEDRAMTAYIGGDTKGPGKMAIGWLAFPFYQNADLRLAFTNLMDAALNNFLQSIEVPVTQTWDTVHAPVAAPAQKKGGIE